MNSLSTFFIALGLYNLVGSIILIGFLSNSFGDFILTKHFKILTNTYKIDTSGALWLVWVIVLNFFVSIINIMAFRWDAIAQFDLLILDIVLYLFFVFLSFFALRSPNYSVGIWFNFPIFCFWIIWGLYFVFF